MNSSKIVTFQFILFFLLNLPVSAQMKRLEPLVEKTSPVARQATLLRGQVQTMENVLTPDKDKNSIYSKIFPTAYPGSQSPFAPLKLTDSLNDEFKPDSSVSFPSADSSSIVPTQSPVLKLEQKAVESISPKYDIADPRALEQDEDSRNPQVAIEWDRWRNHFERAVYYRFNTQLFGDDTINFAGIPIKLGNAPMRHFPPGTKATMQCEITDDKQIKNLRIAKPSGNAEFDSIVLRAAKELNGKSSLKFPKNSHRHVISESESFWIGKTSGFHASKFDDVERY